MSLSLTMMAIWLVLFVTMAVIPSWWLYFWDGTLKIQGSFHVGLGIRTVSLQWQMVRDLIEVAMYAVFLGAAGLLLRRHNQRHPKVLPSGEEKREATGGYK